MTLSTISRNALLVGILAFPLGALAQAAAPTPAAPAATQGDAAQTGKRETRVERRITNLHEKLHVTAAQEPAWTRFAEVMRDNARNMDRTYEQRSQRYEQMTAIDNMQSYAQVAEAHAQDVQKLVPAFQSLYDAMSTEQKRTADQLFRNYAERFQQRGMGPGRHG